MTTTSLLRAVGALALLAPLAGCGTAHQGERHFGANARATLQQQIANPAPPASQTVAGMDGAAAKSAYDNYQKSFKEPVPQTGALAIGVGR